LGGTLRENGYESLDGQDSVREILMNTWPALATNQATHCLLHLVGAGNFNLRPTQLLQYEQQIHFAERA
jgi:hypothetical protein